MQNVLKNTDFRLKILATIWSDLMEKRNLQSDSLSGGDVEFCELQCFFIVPAEAVGRPSSTSTCIQISELNFYPESPVTLTLQRHSLKSLQVSVLRTISDLTSLVHMNDLRGKERIFHCTINIYVRNKIYEILVFL
jgi:hypothetical protein